MLADNLNAKAAIILFVLLMFSIDVLVNNYALGNALQGTLCRQQGFPFGRTHEENGKIFLTCTNSNDSNRTVFRIKYYGVTWYGDGSDKNPLERMRTD